METQTWTKKEYVECLKHERHLFARVFRSYGSYSPADADDAAAACYPYEEPSDLHGLIFHDEAWHRAMLRIHGEFHWLAKPKLESPPQEYLDASSSLEANSGPQQFTQADAEVAAWVRLVQALGATSDA